MKRAVVILLLLLLAGWATWQAAQPSRAPQAMPAWPQFDAGSVYDVRILRGKTEEVHLKKQADGWVIAGDESPSADAQAVGRLLDDLATMRPVRVVTRNRAHYARLQTGDDATRVVLRDGNGKTVFSAWIGKQGSDVISTYVRLENMPEVFAVDRSLTWQVKRSAAGWKSPRNDKAQAASTPTPTGTKAAGP